MKKMRKMRKKLIDHFEAVPEAQIGPGLYVTKIGYKYVTYLNTWNGSTIDRISIDDLYEIIFNTEGEI